MRKAQSTSNKTFHIGTSTTTYMVFGILLSILFYAVALLKPELIKNKFIIALACLLYGAFLIYLFIKGEKLIVLNNTLHLKGMFYNKKVKISDIDSYSVAASTYTGGNKIITLHTNKKDITVSSIPHKSFTVFLAWLESAIDKKEGLEIDPISKHIKTAKTVGSTNNSIGNSALKTYIVGVNLYYTLIGYGLLLLALTIPMLLFNENYISTTTLMYVQVIGALILMASLIIYTMFIRDKLTITKDALKLKGLFETRELRFTDIKGYRIEYTILRKRFKCIHIIPKSTLKKNITIRPAANASLHELTDWVERNFRNLEK
ncbi:hypothetical protein [Aurantibacter sp.]|uniref:hypothetical protein n=1 Tax=Aurantibacter sp. TaxID=2807103 RepID=UPI003265BFB7